MAGADAPKEWQAGHYQKVKDYVMFCFSWNPTFALLG
jgi:hypothetical protein